MRLISTLMLSLKQNLQTLDRSIEIVIKKLGIEHDIFLFDSYALELIWSCSIQVMVVLYSQTYYLCEVVLLGIFIIFKAQFLQCEPVIFFGRKVVRIEEPFFLIVDIIMIMLYRWLLFYVFETGLIFHFKYVGNLGKAILCCNIGIGVLKDHHCALFIEGIHVHSRLFPRSDCFLAHHCFCSRKRRICFTLRNLGSWQSDQSSLPKPRFEFLNRVIL